MKFLARFFVALLPLILAGGALGESPFSTFFESHCTDCHSGVEPEGEIDLASPPAINTKTAGTWQKILTQLATNEMPPDTEPRPALEDREKIMAGIVQGMTHADVTPLFPSGPLPADGNLVDHDLLFRRNSVTGNLLTGNDNTPPSSPPRWWRRSQTQYDSLMERIWVIPKLRYEKAHQRIDAKWAAYSYSRPFPALDPAHFTNYSGGVHADEAVLRALMDAGGQIADRLMSDKTAYDNTLQPPIAAGIPSIRRGSEWEKFKQEPPPRPIEFEPFLGDSTPTIAQQHAAIAVVYELFLNRIPSEEELSRYGGLVEHSIQKNGAKPALRGLITAVMVSPEFVFRMEVGLGPTDEHGRRSLAPNELVYAIAYALTDDGPDPQLWESARNGKLQSKTDVEREVRRILADDSIEKHAKLRFFQEFFGYHRAMDVFKDKPGWNGEAQYLVRDADLLVEHVLQQDKNVLRELLTTDRYFVAYPVVENEELFEAIIANTRAETLAGIEKQKQRGKEIEPNPKGDYSRAWALQQGFELIPRTVHNDKGRFEHSYIHVYGFKGSDFNWTRNQPISVPGRRAGVLTHPAWLVAHSTNTDNDVVRRGHWIREHLLAGAIPDVPLDVEAQVPDEPNETLRHRMRVTRESRCIRCHRRMDPLGFPFEIFDHYGTYRTVELVGERQNIKKELDPSGEIINSGDPTIDGEVNDAIELVHQLAKSRRVQQSFVRHAFRFWMGRNETLNDASVLIDGDNAYHQSNGSFNELLVSLLTSDSFLMRK